MANEKEDFTYPALYTTSEKEYRMKRKNDKDGFVYPSLPIDKKMKQQGGSSNHVQDREAVDTSYIDSQPADSGSDYITNREEDSQSQSFIRGNVESVYFTGQTPEAIRETADSVHPTVRDGSLWEDQAGTSAGTGGLEDPPCEAGAATTTTTLKPAIELALRTWKEKTDNLLDYWSNIFRLSQEYEDKAMEKLELLLSKAQDLDQSTHQQREAVLQRVQGIGQILQYQES